MNPHFDTIKVCFLFRWTEGEAIAGAEMSMLRMLEQVDRRKVNPNVLFFGSDNTSFRTRLESIRIEVATVHGFWELFTVLRQHRPEVLYMFARLHAVCWSFVAMAAGVSTRLVAERGWGTDVRDRLSHFFGRIVGNGFIANSIAAKVEIARSGVKEEKIWVVYNGIDDVQREDYFEKPRVTGGKPQVVCVAHIKPRKDIRTLLLAVKHLRNTFPDLKAILVGHDSTHGKFFRQTKLDNLEDTFVWLGSVSNPMGIIYASDAFVLTSKKEGMPTSILEAMLCSKPVIASAVNGIPELVRHGATGLLFQPSDWRSLSSLLRSIFTNATMAADLGKNARDWVLRNHTVDQMWEGHYKVFKDCRDRTRERNNRHFHDIGFPSFLCRKPEGRPAHKASIHGLKR